MTPLVDPFERMSSRQSGIGPFLLSIFIFCSQLAKTRDREDQEESQPQPGTLLPRRDPYPQSLHISTVTNLANNASAKKYAHGFNSHLSRYTTDGEVFSSQNLFISNSAAYSFTSEISLLTQRKRPLAAPRSVEVQLPALRPGVRIQAWSRNRWGRCRW